MLISELADKTGISVTTIRRYLKRDLIDKPETTWCGWRIFTQKHVDQINKISGRMPSGFEDIGRLIAADLQVKLKNVMKVYFKKTLITKKDIQKFAQVPDFKNVLKGAGIDFNKLKEVMKNGKS